MAISATCAQISCTRSLLVLCKTRRWWAGGRVASLHDRCLNRTGGAGFETNSEVNLTRPDSRTGSTYASSAAASAVDLYAPHPAQDPYAVPPLPHLNPNQPYRDDPNSAYYDPYHGPVPQTFGEGLSHGGVEAIPMTQIGRSRSPAPQTPLNSMIARIFLDKMALVNQNLEPK